MPSRLECGRRHGRSACLRGAPRIHGELLKLGFEVAQSSVAKYMVKRHGRRPRDGAPSCATTLRTSPPWTCSLLRPRRGRGVPFRADVDHLAIFPERDAALRDNGTGLDF